MNNENRIIAIMGPSGSGKTTLGNMLSQKNNIVIPMHTTTRAKRKDDIEGFYRYLSHDEYRQCYLNGDFLLSSGDGPVISPKYGNFQGVFIKDCELAWQKSKDILLYTSYKDIVTLISLKKVYDIQILNVTFNNIAFGVKTRLLNDSTRNHTLEDIESRIYWALKDDECYRKIVDLNASGVIFTDENGISDTYKQACKILKLERR